MFYAGAGLDLCGGLFFAVWALICDLEHGYKSYSFPNPVANICCPLCPANASDLPWLANDRGGRGGGGRPQRNYLKLMFVCIFKSIYSLTTDCLVCV